MPALKHLVYSICLLHFNHLFTPFKPKFKVVLLSALLRKNEVFSCSLSETCSWYILSESCTPIPNDFKSEYRIAFSSTEQWRSCSRLILTFLFMKSYLILGVVLWPALWKITFINAQAKYQKKWLDAWPPYTTFCALRHQKSLKRPVHHSCQDHRQMSYFLGGWTRRKIVHQTTVVLWK